MGGLIKGANAFVPSVPLRIAVRNGLDVVALLLTETGRVRGDADVVFHGAPVHASGAVRLAGGEDGTGWLEVDLTTVEEELVRVLLVGSTETGAMRDVDGLSVEAFASDGTSVARYEVTDGGGETAMVLAELYRRAGGWKFRAVGQGYLDGLAGLAVDHGVDVADDEVAPAPEPVPFAVPTAPVPEAVPFAVPTGTMPAPAPAPVAPAPAPAPVAQPVAPPPPPAAAQPVVPLPAPAPAPVVAQPVAPAPTVPADWSFGAAFEPYLRSGRDNDVISVDGLPPGPVVVDLAVQGDGYTSVWTLDRRNKKDDLLVSSTEKNFRGRLLAVVPESGPLRLKLGAEGPWQVRVLPLAAARRLTAEWLEAAGPEVLLHTAGTADLAIRYRGDENLIVHLYEVAGHEDATSLPKREHIVNEIGRRRETAPLPEGPVIVHFRSAEGPWQARLKGIEPHSGPVAPTPVPGTVPAPAPGAVPAPVAGSGPFGDPGRESQIRKVRNWLRRGA